MNNFIEMPFGNELLLVMYNTPSKELSTEQIGEIISAKLSTEDKTVTVDKLMVSKLYSRLGESLDKDLDLRKRLRVAPKADSTKTPRVTKADVLGDIFNVLGISPVVNGEETNEVNDESAEEMTEQESQYVDEAVENTQLSRNTESIYSSNGVA